MLAVDIALICYHGFFLVVAKVDIELISFNYLFILVAKVDIALIFSLSFFPNGR